MTYSIQFYAMKEHEFAERLRGHSKDLLSELERRLRAEIEEQEEEDAFDVEELAAGAYDDNDTSDEDDDDTDNESTIQAILNAARNICRNDLPPECGEEYFCALGWLLELTSEHITICEFQDFRYLGYLEDIGIWPWFQRRTPSFPMPRNSKGFPDAGFLSLRDMPEIAATGIQSLPPPRDPYTARYALNAREELQHVLSTLIEDQLDLVAVLT